ncbi:MAG: hypothetical protein WBC04_25765 [Candidatus Acidiferrales bacterium]
MKRSLSIGVFVSGMAIAGLALAFHGQANRSNNKSGEQGESRVAHGFDIAPVHLNLEDKDRELVGLGSYLVNGPGACNACHTSQPYDQGGDPFLGQPAKINADHYLAGGKAFGPYISRNITPDEHGLPAGRTFPEFYTVMITGIDFNHAMNDPGPALLQVMPWPTFRNMTFHEIRAIYEYLRAIPHACPPAPPPGTTLPPCSPD